MTPVGANPEVDLYVRLQILESICLQGGFGAASFAMFQGPPQENVLVLPGLTDAISIKSGQVMITGGAVDATTLAAPVAGSAVNGGDDGKILTVICTSAFAHTVTTPANAINGNKFRATFSAAVANFVTFRAYNGVWYVTAQLNATLS